MANNPVSAPIEAPESPITRRDMDFDDNEQERKATTTGHETPSQTREASASPKPRVSFQEGHQEIPPPKPPRPLSPQVQAENTLIEAFPSIDAKVVKAVLAASGGKVEPAFNALLGMTDPDFNQEDTAPPPKPPRPAQRAPQTQLEADEVYARQLADQYNNQPNRGAQTRYNQREPARRGPNQQRHRYETDEEEDRSFFDDDLPEIGRNIQQGFVETQKKVNSWINVLRKRIDGPEGGEEDEEDLYSSSQANTRQNTGKWPQGQQTRQNFGPSQSEQLHGIRKAAEQAQYQSQYQSRRSTEAQRYDADPHELGDSEFERLVLRDDDNNEDAFSPPRPSPAQPPRTSSRAKANPDLFKAQPKPPQSGPVDEVDAAERKAVGAGQDPEKARKWQPLTSVAPAPEEENDPFSLGDDEEEGRIEEGKGEEVRKEDTERLKSAAAGGGEAGEEGRDEGKEKGKGKGRELQEAERSGSVGTRDKAMDELLAEKK